MPLPITNSPLDLLWILSMSKSRHCHRRIQRIDDFPNLTSADWYDLNPFVKHKAGTILPASNAIEPLALAAHATAVKCFFRALNLRYSKVTRLGRSRGTKIAELLSISSPAITHLCLHSHLRSSPQSIFVAPVSPSSSSSSSLQSPQLERSQLPVACLLLSSAFVASF